MLVSIRATRIVGFLQEIETIGKERRRRKAAGLSKFPFIEGKEKPGSLPGQLEFAVFFFEILDGGWGLPCLKSTLKSIGCLESQIKM